MEDSVLLLTSLPLISILSSFLILRSSAEINWDRSLGAMYLIVRLVSLCCFLKMFQATSRSPTTANIDNGRLYRGSARKTLDAIEMSYAPTNVIKTLKRVSCLRRSSWPSNEIIDECLHGVTRVETRRWTVPSVLNPFRTDVSNDVQGHRGKRPRKAMFPAEFPARGDPMTLYPRLLRRPRPPETPLPPLVGLSFMVSIMHWLGDSSY